MKNLPKIVFALFITLLLPSCEIISEDFNSYDTDYDSEQNQDQDPDSDSYFYSNGEVEVLAQSASQSITLCTQYSWEAYIIYSDGTYGSSSYSEEADDDSLEGENTEGSSSGEVDSVGDTYFEGEESDYDIADDAWNYGLTR